MSFSEIIDKLGNWFVVVVVVFVIIIVIVPILEWSFSNKDTIQRNVEVVIDTFPKVAKNLIKTC